MVGYYEFMTQINSYNQTTLSRKITGLEDGDIIIFISLFSEKKRATILIKKHHGTRYT